MRCLTLAESLRARRAQACFICRAHAGSLIGLLQARGYEVRQLPAVSTTTETKRAEDPATWLGVSPEQDAHETIMALGGERPDWLVVDHYELGAPWERTMRAHAGRLMVIDDLLKRAHECDLFLDQNDSGEAQESYRARVPDHCRLAVGPRHALLRPEYSRARATCRSRNGHVARVLIFFGGSDPENLTGRALEATSAAEFAHFEVDVVLGANNPHRAELERAAAARSGTRLLGPQPHLADLMIAADVAIGAGGTTTWERLCLGVPSIVASIAENQRPGCEVLARRGLILYLGTAEQVRTSHIREALRACVRSPEMLIQQSEMGSLLVDGAGALRISECLDATPAQSLGLRPATDHDMYTYFTWVNDPEVRRQSLSPEPIQLQQHREWFTAKLHATESQLFVMLAGELPVGQIRFDRQDAELRIDYSIDPLFRGRGWAKHLVSLGVRAAIPHGAATFRAEVKRGNRASESVFRSLNFAERADANADLIIFQLDAPLRRSAGGR